MLRSPRLICSTISLGSRIQNPLVLHRLLLHSQTRPWTSRWILGARCPLKPLSLYPLQHQACVSCSDLTSQKYTLIYAFPAIRVLRALSRLKLAQTAITMVLLPTVSFFYLRGQASFSMLTYSTAIAVFAGVMLYTISFYVQRVVGMMYLDSEHTTLKVAYLTFWGHRRDMYLPVSDVMTLGDTGDTRGEIILRLKRYSSPETLYFSNRLGHVVDRKAFEKIFGTL